MVVGQRKNVRIDVWIIIAKQITAIELAIDVTEDKKKEKVCLVISNENKYITTCLVTNHRVVKVSIKLFVYHVKYVIF